MRDRLATAHDSDALSMMLDGIEQFREVSRCVGGANFSHKIRLSDNWCRRPDMTLQPFIGGC
jgi:hypothetical protein